MRGLETKFVFCLFCLKKTLFGKINGKEEEKWQEPAVFGDINFESDNYAAGAAIFGRGMECKNCQTRLPYDIVVDISKALGKLQISRYDAKLKVYCLETTETSDALLKVSDTPLPEPIITGPLFENTTDSLRQENRDTQNQEEVKGLQRYLERFGYYADELDGFVCFFVLFLFCCNSSLFYFILFCFGLE